MNYTKNISIILIAPIILFIALAVFFSGNTKTPTVEGQSTFPPYGGPIKRVSYECCFGHIIVIEDEVSGRDVELMYYPGSSDLNQYFQIFTPGPDTVGDDFPVGICISIESECESITFTDGTIRQIGTNLP